MNKKNLILLGTSIFLIGGIMGFLITKISSKNCLTNKLVKSNQNDYQAGWNAAKKKLVESGLVPMIDKNIKIKYLLGVIEKIDGSQLTVKTQSFNPLVNPNSNKRIVLINKDTHFFQLTEKKSQEIEKEMKAFQQAMQTQNKDNKNLIPPTPFSKKTIQLGEIKIGQRISVTSNQDIQEGQKIQAAEIDVQLNFHQPTAILPTEAK